jgi:hypothetical protein
MYQVKNTGRIPIHEELDTKGKDGKPEVLVLGVRQRTTLTDAQWGSRVVQRSIKARRLKSRRV